MALTTMVIQWSRTIPQRQVPPWPTARLPWRLPRCNRPRIVSPRRLPVKAKVEKNRWMKCQVFTYFASVRKLPSFRNLVLRVWTRRPCDRRQRRPSRLPEPGSNPTPPLFFLSVHMCINSYIDIAIDIDIDIDIHIDIDIDIAIDIAIAIDIYSQFV